MIASQNQQAPKDGLSLHIAPEINSEENDLTVSKVQNLSTISQSIFPNYIITHHPKAGLNILVDAAGYLFSILGKLKQLQSHHQLNHLQNELIQEINTFQEVIKHHGYKPEYIVVCRYITCATFDDIISNTSWGGQGLWDNYSLLAAFNQDTLHQDKFFNILERAVKEPTHYIDLMEFIYICLSLGYKGQYRSTEHNHFQLEQITNSLYRHIRSFRGNFSKSLSPSPLKISKSTARPSSQNNLSILFIFFVSVCIVMTIFVSLGYLMDVISNEAYKNISQIENPIFSE